jgi:ribosomal protein S14
VSKKYSSPKVDKSKGDHRRCYVCGRYASFRAVEVGKVKVSLCAHDFLELKQEVVS